MADAYLNTFLQIGQLDNKGAMGIFGIVIIICSENCTGIVGHVTSGEHHVTSNRGMLYIQQSSVDGIPL